MRRSVLLQALDFAGYAGASAIEFCGGEPLLYKDFTWAVDAARERGFRLILRTNGLFLNRRRSFVASNFDSVGISLDGDVFSNDVMRPAKRQFALTAEEKFQIPLREVEALKSLNPGMHVLLASVATRINLAGLCELARLLVDQRVPLDLWKVHQFLANNFRAELNKDEFSLDSELFQQLALDLAGEVNGAFPLICRRSDEIDGSCLIVNRDGDVRLGAKSLGNVSKDLPAILCERLEKSGAEAAIRENKQNTYKGIVHL